MVATEAGWSGETGPVLRAGQRYPMPEERESALGECFESKGAGFPGSGRWEITPDNAARWAGWNLTRLAVSVIGCGGVDPSSDELALLVWDLDLWRRLPNPPRLVDYLRPGRENWGWFTVLRRVWVARSLGGGVDPEAAECLAFLGIDLEGVA